MPAVNCVDVTKVYTHLGQVVSALRNVTFGLAPNEFVTVVGRSGCGKSTLLRLIAGIEEPTSGRVELECAKVRCPVGLVFQNNAVFPWRTVRGNLAFALEAQNAPRAVIDDRVATLAAAVGLDTRSYLGRFPRELSGGEVRRVAIGMTLASDADVMLFDEPTAQLDYLARHQIGQTVQQIWSERRFTALYVTHDIDEAILLGDRVLLLDAGQLKDQIPVPFPRPRSRGLLDTPQFVDLRREVLSRFEQG